MNKRVLITGGAGFVGSNLAHRLVKEGADVIVVDNLFTGDLENLKDILGSIAFVEEDITEGFDVNDYQPEIIYHLAARNISSSMKDPILDYSTNIGGTLLLLEAVRERHVERFIYTSSASVYGNPRYLPINEDDGINLLTPYATSKYAGEGYCTAYYESYNIPTVVLRLSNVYGPRQSVSNPFCGVVAKFMNWAKNGENIIMHGDGLSTRDYTYIDDVVDALILAGISPKAEGEVFNVATGIETSTLELANSVAILHILDHMDDDFDIDVVCADRRDIDNIRRRALNIEKIRRKLGWMPRYTLESGLALTKKWEEEKGG